MPWKLGGNYESVRLMCKTGWEECATAVASYLWFEIVSDVVDFLTKEGMTWALAISVVLSTILICAKSRKSARTESNVGDKRILNKVGYKLQDLELKVNVLTYKVQYGTWPLPHQIYSLNPRKLQKIRTTLSNPVDRKDWMKRALSVRSRRSSFRLTRNASAEDLSDLSRSGDFRLQRRNNTQLLPLVNERDRRSPAAPASNARLTPWQDFTGTVYRCRSFLKELKCNDERPRLSSHSSEGKVSSSRGARATEQAASLTAEKREASDEAVDRGTTRRRNTNETVGRATRTEGVDEAHRPSGTNVSSSATNNEVALPRRPLRELLTRNQPTRKPARRPSRETLYQVRRRLQSVRDMLRAYGDTESRAPERRNPTDRLGEVVPRISEVDESEIEANNRRSGSGEASPRVRRSDVDSCEYFDLDQTEGSSSSLCECTSNTTASAKTDRDSSDVASRKIRPQGHDQRDEEQFPPDHGVGASRAPGYCEDPGGRCECDVSDRGAESRSNSRPEGDTTGAQFRAGKGESGGTRCVSSPGDGPVKRHGASSRSEIVIDRINDRPDGGGQRREHAMTVSQGSSGSKISMRSDRERRRSTALLLREALLFKQALLTQVESAERRLTRGADENNVAGEPPEYETRVQSSGNFPAMVVDIETEGSLVDVVRGRLDRPYVRLEMKQRRDPPPPPPRALRRNVSAPTRRESDEEEELAREAPSEYFSICDLPAVPGDGARVGSDAPLALKPPIYERVVSIMIPVDVEGQDAGEDAAVGDRLDDDLLVGKRPPVMLGLEDLILERVRMIRDYMDVFLRSENRAISKARRALRDPENNAPGCPDQASHVILHDEFTVPFGYRDASDRVAAYSSKIRELGNSGSADANAVTPSSEPPSDIECSKSKPVIDSRLILSTNPQTKEGDRVIRDRLSSLEEETLNADGGLSSGTKRRRSPGAPVKVANPSSRLKQHSTKRLHRTNPRIKTKSDISLMTGTTKGSSVGLHPKRSHLSLTQRTTLERIRRTLRQSEVKSHGEKDEGAESRSRSLLQRISARSCIPILRNRLETARHQTSTRSPTRSPLTMLWRDHGRRKSRTTDEEATKQRRRRQRGLPMDEGSRAEETTALDLRVKAGAGKRGGEIAEEPEETDATNDPGGLSDDRSAQLHRRIDKERADTTFAHDGRSDAAKRAAENMGPKTLAIVSAAANDDPRTNRPAGSHLSGTKNARFVTTDRPPTRNTESRVIAVDKEEKEVTVKPSIADTCTSVTGIH